MTNNKFYYRLFLDEIPYSISVEITEDTDISIIINNTKVVSERFQSSAKSLYNTDFTYYYPIRIKKYEIIVSVISKDAELQYNVFVNGKSPVDSSLLNDELDSYKKTVDEGIIKFFRSDYRKNLKYLLTGLVAAPIAAAMDFKHSLLLIAAVLIADPIIVLPIATFFDWIVIKNKIKNYSKRFRYNPAEPDGFYCYDLSRSSDD